MENFLKIVEEAKRNKRKWHNKTGQKFKIIYNELLTEEICIKDILIHI